jgi:hypothetical protein
MKLPKFGDQAGKDMDDASVTPTNLRWYLGVLERKVNEAPDGKFSEENRKIAAGIRAELGRRGESAPAPKAGAHPKKPQPQEQRSSEPTQAIQVAGQEGVIRFEGSFSNAARANQAIRAAQEQCHLVSPAPVCGRLPEGYELAITMVRIDPYGRGVYAITGDKKNPSPEDEVGLDKTSLIQISNAAGADWVASQRADDRRTQFFCAWEAVAEVQLLDGRKVKRRGNVDIDARDGSGYISEIRSKAERRARENPEWKNDGGESQLLELRKFYTRHAESKAMERAIANLGIRRSYKRKDLEKPFAVVSLSFTGRSDDPETRRYFAQRIADAALGSANNLYGAQPAALPAAMPAAVPQLRAAPPVGTVPYDPDAYETEGEEYGCPPAPKSEPKPAPAPEKPSPETAEQSATPAPGSAPKQDTTAPQQTPAAAPSQERPAARRSLKDDPAEDFDR